MPKSFRNLVIWQEGMELLRMIHAETALFPREEQDGLASDLRTAVIMVPGYVVKGYGRRRTRQQFASHLVKARSTVHRVETLLLVARDLGYLDAAATEELLKRCDCLRRRLTRTIAMARTPHRRKPS